LKAQRLTFQNTFEVYFEARAVSFPPLFEETVLDRSIPVILKEDKNQI